jgi:hypothetical protein
MGILVNGQWRDEDLAAETGKAGDFQRIESRFRERRPRSGAITFTSPTAAPGRIAR